jgi:hypothetical protein
MDHLRKFMEVLRTLVRQPASANRQHLVEREINQYIRDAVGDKKASVERLSAAKQGGDWRMMREYVQLCCVFECPVQIEEWESGSNAPLSLLNRYIADLKSGHFGNKSPL